MTPHRKWCWARGVKSLRIFPFRTQERVRLEIFPADCPHPVPFGIGDSGIFQHMATLYH